MLQYCNIAIESGGRVGPAAKKLLDEVVAECEMPEAARKAAASKIMRAIGIEVLHKQAYMTATLVRNGGAFVHIWVFGFVPYSYSSTLEPQNSARALINKYTTASNTSTKVLGSKYLLQYRVCIH